MSVLSNLMYPLAGLYAGVGYLIFRMARRQGCRVCLLRNDCPTGR
jgi:hypothetical protein